MPFVQKDPEDDLDQVLGTRERAPTDPSEAKGWSGLRVDTELRYCVNCRRELLPWQDGCPDDGGRGVRQSELPSREDELLERFLAQQSDEPPQDSPQDGGTPP